MSADGVPGHLADDALLPLWRAVHDRLSSGRAVRSVTVQRLDDAAQEALADLLGWATYPGPRATVRLDRLDAALALSGTDARTVVETVVGPLTDRAAEQARVAGEREALWTWLGSHPVVTAQPALLGWVEQVRSEGVPSSGSRGLRERLDTALNVVASLPLPDGRPLPDLAAEATGDPHGLDQDRPLSRAVLRALSALRAEPAPENAQERRDLWGAFGVDCDAHSSNVLVLGLRPGGAGPLPSTLRTWAEAGRAVSVTLDQLDAEELVCRSPVVHVVENPSVLALAQRRLGTGCPPLVCVSGWPGNAAVALLQRLAACGSELRYHGDFDGEGLRIAAHVMVRTGARPWRMGTEDYLEAAERVHTAPPPGRLTPAPWDAGLDRAIASHGVAVHEERVAERLLLDLRAEAEAQRTARGAP
ncbi:TIGR02679 family protein [Nocardiopsis sp. HNM0947]|uniref:TIGR02679 family protein n=1 Tax=Nocardiopsis coralli TaxID=2772213 RepID=A0ABR9P1J8_9ACTN|nr:TIGR02679 family protein [Nocardiopsis coralli]MBE2997707.1 TIGR02679 family protein [Nocardiopsis coralli]